MITQPELRRWITDPVSTGSSFDEELRRLLRRRAVLVFTVGLAATVVGYLLHNVVLRTAPSLETPLTRWQVALWAASPAGFLGGLLGVLAWKDAGARQLQRLIFAIFAAEIVLVLLLEAAVRPADPLFIAVAVLLFIPASLIPWPLGYQVGLGAVAVGSFLLGRTLTYVFVPGSESFWAEHGGSAGFAGHLIEGMVGDLVLAGIAVVTCGTLYSLRKSAHKAKRLGNYLIHRELDRGGMGQVFLAEHALMCRPTAVKVLRPDRDDPEAAARFEREVRLSATLTHPNTITIYDFGRTLENEFYYAMEYLEGLDLQELVERFGPVNHGRTVYILLQVAGSLAEAHSREVIHRDIKPSNIFLTRRGGLYDFVKVLDFGLAKEIAPDASSVTLSQSGTIHGTPLYVSPEAVYGSDEIDGRADIYGLGGVAYWMLTGRPPFSSDRTLEVLVDHVKTVPRPPSAVSELPIPEELDALVMKCLEKRPEARYQTAEELEDALRSIALESVWDREKARDWWNLHALIGDDPFDCKCFPLRESATHEAALTEPSERLTRDVLAHQ